MHHMSSFRSAALLFPMALLVACGVGRSSSNSNPITLPPPVSAQTTYSISALSGVYSFSIFTSGPAGICSSLETADLDGNGNIDTVRVTGAPSYAPPNAPTTCTLKGEGTYSVSNDASGTASIVINTANGNLQRLTFSLEAAQQGASFLLVENDGVQSASITALKQ